MLFISVMLIPSIMGMPILYPFVSNTLGLKDTFFGYLLPSFAGGQVAAMGFKGMLTEGAKHVLGWKSPHYLYHCNIAPNLKLLLRDVEMSDDISLRFNNSEWEGYPLFADNYINRIASLPDEEQLINILIATSFSLTGSISIYKKTEIGITHAF